jgi:hypothetical protein
MKNKFLELNQEQRTPLCKLGLNVAHIRCLKKNNRYYDIEDIVNDLIESRNIIITNDVLSLYDFIENKIIKNETIFKNVYFYKSNITANNLNKCLSDLDKKQVVLNRIDLLIYQLQSY